MNEDVFPIGKGGFPLPLEGPSTETNSLHLKIGRAPKGNDRIPLSTHQFSLAMLVSGSIEIQPSTN